jgi:hypothetical protein
MKGRGSMPDATEAARTEGGQQTPGGAMFADMASLVIRARAFLAERRERTSVCKTPYDTDTLSNRFGFSGRGKGKTEIVLAEDVAVELGHPSTASQASVLLSSGEGLIHHGQITIVGQDLDAMDEGGRHPFAQVVLLAVRPDKPPDPFAIDNTQFLMHRLPGYMIRSVPGKLWVRISKAARAEGLTLKTVGSALIAAYTEDVGGVEAAEIVFVTSSREDVEALSQISTEANILGGRHKKLVLGVDGEVECPELRCDTCEEKPVCDSLRDIVIKRRSKRK